MWSWTISVWKMSRWKIKLENLPSFFMPALKHFLSLQYLHWFLLSLSTTQFLPNLKKEKSFKSTKIRLLDFKIWIMTFASSSCHFWMEGWIHHKFDLRGGELLITLQCFDPIFLSDLFIFPEKIMVPLHFSHSYSVFFFSITSSV